MWSRAVLSITTQCCAALKRSRAAMPSVRISPVSWGAFGAALIARERYDQGKETTMLPIEKINTLEYKTTMANCKGLYQSLPSDYQQILRRPPVYFRQPLVNGVSARKRIKTMCPTCLNISTKNSFPTRLFPSDKAVRGKVGIPRVLNMFENYPFWYTFFTDLKYQVVLSPTSTRKIYELGIESIPSESECYPPSWLTDMWPGC